MEGTVLRLAIAVFTVSVLASCSRPVERIETAAAPSSPNVLQVAVPLADAAGYDSVAACDPLGSATPLYAATDSTWPDFSLEAAADSYLYAQMAFNAYQDSTKLALPDSITEERSIEDPRTGFAVTVYEVRSGSQLREAVLAFRGTEDRLDWWHGNFRFTQNRQAVSFYESMREFYGESIPIVSVGHSLGGGLALQISVLYDGATAYLFNGSYHIYRPRTTVNGVYAYHEAKSERYSVASHAEANQAVRGPLPNPTLIHTRGFVCTDVRGPVFNHSIERLARCLTHVAAITSEGARGSLRRIAVPCLLATASDHDESESLQQPGRPGTEALKPSSER